MPHSIKGWLMFGVAVLAVNIVLAKTGIGTKVANMVDGILPSSYLA